MIKQTFDKYCKENNFIRSSVAGDIFKMKDGSAIVKMNRIMKHPDRAKYFELKRIAEFFNTSVAALMGEK